ncbi:MAG: glycosyltransferase family 4 protein [Candidatus Latescibacterota bacterium]|nr:glycosyltransferase family 4 protein [Candidatus Latescibacterota bacterium]
MKHKLYFVACCFPPFGRGNAITNACVANHLAADYDVEVVCMEREDGGLIAYQQDRSLEQGLHPRLRVHRVPAPNWLGLNIALYAIGLLPCYYLNWAWRVWRRRAALFAAPGAIFAVYPVFSDLVVGYLVSRWKNLPLLVDFRDDFSGVMARGGRRFLGPVYRFMERRIVAAADRVSVTTDALRRDVLARYGLPPEKVEVVYNIVPPAATAERRGDGDTAGPLRVIYAGAMSAVQKPEILIRAYDRARTGEAMRTKRVEIELYGPESPYFKTKIRKSLVPGCRFGGFLPQAEVAERVATADIGFFSLSDATYAYATPTKLFDYIEAGVPIVASLPQGAAREIVERYEIGLVSDAGDVEDLARCLRTMIEDGDLRRRCRGNAESIRGLFSAQTQIEKWRKMLGHLDLPVKDKGDRDDSNALPGAIGITG